MQTKTKMQRLISLILMSVLLFAMSPMTVSAESYFEDDEHKHDCSHVGCDKTHSLVPENANDQSEVDSAEENDIPTTSGEIPFNEGLLWEMGAVAFPYHARPVFVCNHNYVETGTYNVDVVSSKFPTSGRIYLRNLYVDGISEFGTLNGYYNSTSKKVCAEIDGCPFNIHSEAYVFSGGNVKYSAHVTNKNKATTDWQDVTDNKAIFKGMLYN